MKNSIYAVLGSTNTGKTFFAIEKMLTFKNGLVGFPLRLLAKENYERIAKKIGKENVALVTGEEKIIPSTAKYFFCTVEAMPETKSFEFIAIDEVQLASNFERGHLFTNKILNSRGRKLTVFLGSLSMKGLLKKIFPDIKIIIKTRLSNLNYYGYKNLTRLPKRSAIIAFSQLEVYEIAEKIRKFKGGASLVMGALSPEARNAQVELFERGDVDYIVATDAIGLGLNLSIKYIFFTNLIKYDGFRKRFLTFDEISQIAGRAGRYKDNGFFGVTQNLKSLDEDLIKFIENYDFNEVDRVYWRNSNLNFSSITKLKKSLQNRPSSRIFILKKNSYDYNNLINLSQNEKINENLTSKKEIKLFWEICSIPDYLKVFDDYHSNLLLEITNFLIRGKKKFPKFLVDKEVKQIERFTDKISLINMKISQIRTWSFIINKKNWVEDVLEFKKKIKKIEIKLSNRLHKLLINKFTEISFKENKEILLDNGLNFVTKNNANQLLINNKVVGCIRGFKLILKNTGISKKENPFLHKKIRNSMNVIFENLLSKFLDSDFSDMDFDSTGNIFWKNQIIGNFSKGEKLLLPKVNLDGNDFFSNASLDLAKIKLKNFFIFLESKYLTFLKVLKKGSTDKSFRSSHRAICFGLLENLGHCRKNDFYLHYKRLNSKEIKYFKQLNFVCGNKFYYIKVFDDKFFQLTQMLTIIFNKPKIYFKPFRKLIQVKDKINSEAYKELTVLGFYKIKVLNNNYLIYFSLFEKILDLTFFFKRKKILPTENIIRECQNDRFFIDNCFKRPEILLKNNSIL